MNQTVTASEVKDVSQRLRELQGFSGQTAIGPVSIVADGDAITAAHAALVGVQLKLTRYSVGPDGQAGAAVETTVPVTDKVPGISSTGQAIPSFDLPRPTLTDIVNAAEPVAQARAEMARMEAGFAVAFQELKSSFPGTRVIRLREEIDDNRGYMTVCLFFDPEGASFGRVIDWTTLPPNVCLDYLAQFRTIVEREVPGVTVSLGEGLGSYVKGCCKDQT
jgi:hypothetical protein